MIYKFSKRATQSAPFDLVGESSLVSWGVTIRIGWFSGQTLLGAWQGLDIQPCYKDIVDLLIEIVAMQWLTLG